jgi:hypothetical protein
MTTGSCLCGAVRFSVTECSIDIYKCHCSRCRKNFGGASSAATFVDESNFSWLQGEDVISRFELTPTYSKQFCTSCGSILPALIPGRSTVWVPAGLFDDDPGVPLGRHIFVDSKAEWEVLDNHLEQLKEGFDF